MNESEWLTCEEPDLLLEVIEHGVSREHLIEFVRRSWARITPFLPPFQSDITVVEEYESLAPNQSDHDAVVYAAEAALKAARWAPDMKEEQRVQAALLRQIFGNPFRARR